MADTPIVQVASLTHRYGERTALDSVEFDVDQATILGLLGPNGSGKTTLFSILATHTVPTSGTARIAGADVVTDRRRVRKILGIVFQSPSLDDQLTVRENLFHQGHLYGLSGPAVLRALGRRGEGARDSSPGVAARRPGGSGHRRGVVSAISPDRVSRS